MTLVIVLGLTAFGVTWAEIESLEGPGVLCGEEGLFVLDLLLGIFAIALYPWRRRWPLVIVTASTLSSLAIATAAFGLVSISTRRRRGKIIVVSLLFLTSAYVSDAVFPSVPETDASPWWQFLVFMVVVNAVLIVTGLYIGGRRHMVTVLQERAERIQREHDVRVEAAAMAERTRIERDMHDALAHRLSLVALHAGVLEYRTDLSPDQAREAAGIVRENAHLAANDLREVLGVLRDPQLDETIGLTRAPPAIVEAVELLVQESRAAGNPTTLRVDDAVAVHADELPAAARGHVGRVV